MPTSGHSVNWSSSRSSVSRYNIYKYILYIIYPDESRRPSCVRHAVADGILSSECYKGSSLQCWRRDVAINRTTVCIRFVDLMAYLHAFNSIYLFVFFLDATGMTYIFRFQGFGRQGNKCSAWSRPTSVPRELRSLGALEGALFGFMLGKDPQSSPIRGRFSRHIYYYSRHLWFRYLGWDRNAGLSPSGAILFIQ